jgi:alkyl hydroperoxide reductase subunit AhpF
MPVLGERDRAAIAEMFTEAVRPVEVRIVVAGTPDPAGRTGFRAAAAELAEIVPLVRVREIGSASEEARGLVERVPGVALFDAEGADLRVRFAGQPAGYEFSSFVAAVADAAGAESGLQPSTLEALGALKGDVQILVFSTPT